MLAITKQLRGFCAAHRLTHGYSGKCSNLHGHNYNINITFCAPSLNKHGFVMDFSVIKQLFEPWIKENWDHGTIVSADDNELLDFLKKAKQKYYVLPPGCNSTIETMSKFLYEKFNDILKKQENKEYKNVNLTRIEISETGDNFASYSPD